MFRHAESCDLLFIILKKWIHMSFILRYLIFCPPLSLPAVYMSILHPTSSMLSFGICSYSFQRPLARFRAVLAAMQWRVQPAFTSAAKLAE